MSIWIRLLLATFLILAAPAARSSEITFRNDLREDEEGAVLTVSEIVTSIGFSTAKQTIRSGQERNLSKKDIRSFTITRDFGSYSKFYGVRCDPTRKGRITMKLIDVSMDRMPGGCKLVKRGTKDRFGSSRFD